MATTNGINIRETAGQIVFRALMLDIAGARVTTGTTSLYLYELQSDGTLKSYDFSSNTFKTTALTTETLSLTHRSGNNSTTSTGVWTGALSTLTSFTAGAVYLALIFNANASPTWQAREFQYGGTEGLAVLNATQSFDNVGQTTSLPANVRAFLGTLLTETTPGWLTAGFKKFFNTAVPTLTTSGVDQTGDGYARLGAPAGASVSADLAANLAAILNVQNGTFVSVNVPPTLELPDTGTDSFLLTVVFTDETSAPKNLDSGNPSVVLINGAGTSRAGRLGAWSNPATGKYTATYTNTAGDAIELLTWEITGTVNTKLRRFVAPMQVVDTTAVDFTSADRTKLTQLATDYTTARAAKIDNLDVATSTRLAPTVAGRTLDVSVGGEAGLDWANVGSPTTTLVLSGTTLAPVTLASSQPNYAPYTATQATSDVTSLLTNIAGVPALVWTYSGGARTIASVTTVTGDVAGKLLGGGSSIITAVGAWAFGPTGGAVTLPIDAPTGYGSLIITPILASAVNPRYSTRNLAKIAAASAPTDVLTITDGSGSALDLSGKTLRLVAFTVNDNDDDDTANLDIFDDILIGSFKYETGSELSIGGTGNNQVTIQHSATKTATPGAYHYNLWNVTDRLLLAKGEMPIEPAMFDL